MTFGACVLFAGPGWAAPAPVRLSCDDLGPDEATEVEARIRATLLTDTSTSVKVRIHCEDELATILATVAGRSESAVIALPSSDLKTEILAAVDRTLAALERSATAQEPPPREHPSAIPVPVPAPVTPDRTRDVCVAAPGASTPREHGFELRAGVSALVESWSGPLAYGGRALVEAGRPRWAVGFGVGGMTSAERAGAFVPGEWHALLSAAVMPGDFGGIRAAGHFGMSLLVASPSAGIVAHSATTLASPFVELALGRPFHAGRVAFVPEIGARIASVRNIVLDGATRFTWPALAPYVTLGMTYDL